MTILGDIQGHWISRHAKEGQFPKLEWKQRGGAIVSVNGHNIHVRETKKGDTIYIHGGPTRPCFELHLYMKEHHAVLSDVIRRPLCFLNGEAESRYIVRAAIKIAKERGIRTLEFTDNSRISCNPGVSGTDRIILSDLSFITTGKTWYESIIPNLTATDCPKLEQWRHLVLTNTWRKVGHGFPMFDIGGINIDDPGSAMAVLARAKKSRTKCNLLSEHLDTLLTQSGVDRSLWGRHWVCQL